MATIQLSKEQIEKFGKMYDKLPNIECEGCYKGTERKEISKRDFMLFQYLRERYY